MLNRGKSSPQPDNTISAAQDTTHFLWYEEAVLVHAQFNVHLQVPSAKLLSSWATQNMCILWLCLSSGAGLCASLFLNCTRFLSAHFLYLEFCPQNFTCKWICFPNKINTKKHSDNANFLVRRGSFRRTNEGKTS